MRFLSSVLATIVGLFVFLFLAIILIIGIAAAGSGSSALHPVENNTIITLDLNTVEHDYAGKFIFKDFGYSQEEHTGLINVLTALEKAKTDRNIKGISILNSSLKLGMAQSKSLRDKLLDFKKSGKFIVAYADNFSQKDYYLNSVADTIYLNPVGELEFKGLASEVMYFKDFQEKSGVKMEIIRHGKYKSAVEPFLANEMSPENREQISAILKSVWDVVVSDIATTRKIPVGTLNTIAENLDARTPENALKNKLIDKIAYEDEYHNGIKKALKLPKDEDYKTISILKYAENAHQTPSDNTETIAVVYAQGAIWGGEGDESYVGEQSLKRALGDIRKNKDVKAVVLRIDSPGGSALTSELIWREVELTKKVKPVIVSMGNTAASGGYYIACGAHRIFAEPNTITGSIGVFGQLPNFSQLAKNMGIKTQLVQTHKNAADYSVFEPIQENYKTVVTQSIESIYNIFLHRVAAGRKMSTTQVDAIAQGRVWSGNDALKIGLVDELGGLDKAIAYAAKLTKTKTYKTVNYPEYEIDFNKFMSGYLGFPIFESRESLLKNEIGEENYRILEQIRRVNTHKGIQTIMPYELYIK
jgi:protease-4